MKKTYWYFVVKITSHREKEVSEMTIASFAESNHAFFPLTEVNERMRLMSDGYFGNLNRSFFILNNFEISEQDYNSRSKAANIIVRDYPL